MNSNKVLILTTYPIKNPKHGGQKRASAIRQAYSKRFTEVRHSSVFYRGFYSEYEKDDIPLGKTSEILVNQSPLTGDIIAGEAIYNDPSVKIKMTDLLTSFRPDIIHIEQPFPYIGLKPLLKDLNMNPKLVFGSQNIEAPMKTDILKNARAPLDFIKKTETLIDDLEKELSADSDLVIACTSSDLEAHLEYGAKKVVLAKNGTEKSRTNKSSLDHWQRFYHRQGVENTVLFVGSAHPPNWNGFIDVIGKGLGFLPFDTRIVIAGSICDYFDREIKDDSLDIEDATFWLRAISAGRLSEESLGALIQLSDVIILPITEGGGSNLKTAEAILADKKVVTTSHGLRSYEWFKDFPNVWIADTQKSFRLSIKEALKTTFKQRTVAQQKLAEQVLWEDCLAEMVKEVSAL